MSSSIYIKALNGLGEDFPTVESIRSDKSDFGGSLETLVLESGGEIQFYITEQDLPIYLAKIVSYYALSQLVHIVEKFNKVTHNIELDRSTDLILLYGNSYKLREFVPTRSKYSDIAWDDFKEVVTSMKLNLEKLNFTYVGTIPRP